MGIFSRNKKVDKNSDRAWSNLTDAFFSFAGKRKSIAIKNKSEILKISQQNPWLSLAIEIRANAVAGAELYIEETIKGSGEAKEVIEHPLLKLLKDPNPLLEGYSLMYIIQAWCDLVGECLVLLDRDEKNNIVGLYPVSSECIHQMPYANNPYWKLTAGTEIISVYVTEAMYIKRVDLSNVYGRGIGKGQAVSDEITIHELSGKQMGNYFANSAIPPYAIGLEQANVDQAKAVRDNWIANNTGWVKRYLPYFFAGKLNIHKLQSEFKDMELNQLRKDQKDVIMQFFQIPEELYGKSDNSNRSTSYIAETNFSKQVTVPNLNFITNYFNNYLMPEFQTAKNKNIIQKIKYRNIVPRDKEFERDTKKAIPWAFSLNEHRRVAGENDVEGFEDIYPIPLGMKLTKFEDLTKVQQEAIKTVKQATGPVMKQSDDIRMAELIQIIDSVPYDELNEAVVDEYVALLQKTGTSVLIDIGILGTDDTWEIINPRVVEQIEELAGNRIKLIDDTLKKNLRNEMIEGYNSGESIPKLMKRLNDNVFDGYKTGYELERIARTETMTTVNYSTLLAYEDTEVPYKEWIATKDDRTRDSHMDMDGQVVGIKEEFESGNGYRAIAPGQFGVAEEDINCFIGETEILTDSPIKNTFKHKYEGELIEIITATGIKLTGTPNHPIMTDKGWVALGDINKFDKVVVYDVTQDLVLGVNPNVINIPTAISDIAKFGEMINPAGRVTSRDVNFHGYIPKSEVEIVPFKGFLQDEIETELFKFMKDFNFKFSNLIFSFFASKSFFGEFFIGTFPTTDRFMSFFREFYSFFFGGVRHSSIHSFGTVSDMDFVFPENSVNNLSADVVQGGELLDRSSGLIKFDNVVAVNRRVSSCHVYNLHTENEIYYAGNIIPDEHKKSNGNYKIMVHNCRCTLGAAYKEKKSYDKAKYWKKQDNRAADAEKDFKKAYAKRFQKIQLDINSSLKELN